MKPDEPPPPSRTRLLRPSFYRSERTGSLAPDVRDLLMGLTTLADDEGWILWRPSEIAATLYPYQSAVRRLRDLERRATRLVERELIDLRPCGCAFLPTLKEHHAVKGGDKTQGIWGWHQRVCSVGLRSATEESVSVSGESSSSDSLQGADTSSPRARKDAPAGGGASCDECHRPTSVHAPTCSQAPHLRATA